MSENAGARPTHVRSAEARRSPSSCPERAGRWCWCRVRRPTTQPGAWSRRSSRGRPRSTPSTGAAVAPVETGRTTPSNGSTTTSRPWWTRPPRRLGYRSTCWVTPSVATSPSVPHVVRRTSASSCCTKAGRRRTPRIAASIPHRRSDSSRNWTPAATNCCSRPSIATSPTCPRRRSTGSRRRRRGPPGSRRPGLYSGSCGPSRRTPFDAAVARSVTGPVLLVVGADSPDDIAADPDVVAAALPDARVDVVAGQAHLAHLADPETFAARVLAFLDD